MWPFKRASDPARELSFILSEERNKEEFLGVRDTVLPSPEQIRNDAAKLSSYSRGSDYKVFADEAWGRVIMHLDKILDDKSSNELRQYHCGAAKATLDLLRLSYQARSVRDSYDKAVNESLPQK